MTIMEDFTQTLVHYKVAFVLIWLAFIFILEIFSPILARIKNPSRFLNNLGLWGVNSAISLLVIIPVASWATEHTISWRPEISPIWVLIIVDFLILDALIYWWHRANHEIVFLWKFHEIHHLDQFLDITTSVRFHFGEVVLSTCFRVIIIILLDIPFISVVVFEILLLMASGFHHANIKISKSWETRLSMVFVTPSIHGVHHHAIRADTNSNYSSVLSCWDRFFKSQNRKSRTPDLLIGVENEIDVGFLNLLIRPFLNK